MRCPCPTAAQAWRSPSERGRSLSPSTRIPMPTAPLDTSTISRPASPQLGQALESPVSRATRQLAVVGDDVRPQLDDDAVRLSQCLRESEARP